MLAFVKKIMVRSVDLKKDFGAFAIRGRGTWQPNAKARQRSWHATFAQHRADTRAAARVTTTVGAAATVEVDGKASLGVAVRSPSSPRKNRDEFHAD